MSLEGNILFGIVFVLILVYYWLKQKEEKKTEQKWKSESLSFNELKPGKYLFSTEINEPLHCSSSSCSRLFVFVESGEN